MTTRVLIRNLELLARIGVHGHEQGLPQPIRINLDLVTSGVPEDDRLESAVDYEHVVDLVREIVASAHFNLAETLAERIASACLVDNRVRCVRLRLEKLHALRGAEAAGVEIIRRAK